MKKGKVKAMWR